MTDDDEPIDEFAKHFQRKPKRIDAKLLRGMTHFRPMGPSFEYIHEPTDGDMNDNGNAFFQEAIRCWRDKGDEWMAIANRLRDTADKLDRRK